MTAKNPITGDDLISRAPTEEYKAGWERIFGREKPPVVPPIEPDTRRRCHCDSTVCEACK